MRKKINKLPLISIILNSHNGSKYLSTSINSAIKQKYKNWELIIFDNNSTDNTSSIIKKYKNKDKRIRSFKSSKLLNLYDARNKAIEKARGDYISFLDSDDWWEKNKLYDQINLLKKERVNVVYSNLYIFNEMKKKYYIFSKENLYNGKITQLLLNNFKMPILTTLLRKKIFKFQKFDKRFNIIGDFDFFTKISLKEKIISTNNPLAYYRIHQSNLTSKRLDLNIKELEIWIKENIDKKRFKKFSFKKLKMFVNTLKIKKLFLDGENIKALISIMRGPYYFKKFKFLPFLFVPKIITKKILSK